MRAKHDPRLRVGFITGTSDTFCDSCDRLRVAADGMLRPCLATDVGVSAKVPAQAGESASLAAAIQEAWQLKPDGKSGKAAPSPPPPKCRCAPSAAERARPDFSARRRISKTGATHEPMRLRHLRLAGLERLGHSLGEPGESPCRGQPSPSPAGNRFVDGMYHLMIGRGYEAATIRRIATAARLTPGVIHYHFKNKLQKLLRAVLERLETEHTRNLDRELLFAQSPAEMVATFIDLHLDGGPETANPEAVCCWVIVSGEALRRSGFAGRGRKCVPTHGIEVVRSSCATESRPVPFNAPPPKLPLLPL